MSSSLEHLFGQILFSEQKAHERRCLINQVKTNVGRTCEKISELREELESSKRRLGQKLEEWNNAQLELKSCTVRQSILSSQKEELIQTQNKHQKQLTDVTLKIDTTRQVFCKRVQDFTASYDLCSSGAHQRELLARDALRKLCSEEESLNADLSSYKEHQVELQALKSEQDRYATLLRDAETKLKDTRKPLEREEKLCLELEREKMRLTELPYNDIEFMRLQADLEASRDNDLEMVCSALQRQQQELQQRLWQQELGRKRTQQQREQSSYRHWQHRGQSDEQDGPSQIDSDQPEPATRPTQPNIARLTQGMRSGTQGMRSGTQGMRSGTQGMRSGTQGMRSGTQGMRSGTQGMRSGTQGMRSGKESMASGNCRSSQP